MKKIQSMIKTILPDTLATETSGRQWASYLVPGLVITLVGDLGAGKTTWVRGVLHGLGVVGAIKSPTYSLVEAYSVSRLYLYHFDLYRFQDSEEWEAAGFREYFRDDAIILIEWPEKAVGVLPLPDLVVSIDYVNIGREITIAAKTPKGEACLVNWIKQNEKKVHS